MGIWREERDAFFLYFSMPTAGGREMSRQKVDTLFF